MDSPSAKIEYGTPNGMIVLIFVLALHDLDNVMCVPLDKCFFAGVYVVFRLGTDLVENAKALLIVQQKLRKGLLVHGSGETLDDLVADVDLAIRSLIVKADVDDAFRHERLMGFRNLLRVCSQGSFINDNNPE